MEMPKELRDLDLSSLDHDIIFDSSKNKYRAIIHDPELKETFPNIVSNTKERVDVCIRYYYFKHLTGYSSC